MAIKPWSGLSESEVIEAVSNLRSISDIKAAPSPTIIESAVRQKVKDPEIQKQLLDSIHTRSRERAF